MSLHYTTSRIFVRGILRVVTGWRVTGRGDVPRSGGLIVASNHVSFWDPPLVGGALPRELHYLAKGELFRVPILGPLIKAYNAIPIRRGVADLSGMARAIEVLRRGCALLMFPEGSRMRDGELHPARPGVGMLAVNADVRILPVFINGGQAPGKWLVRGIPVRVAFGVPRSWREFAGSEVEPVPGRDLYQKVGEGVMRSIASLKAEVFPTASRGAARPLPHS